MQISDLSSDRFDVLFALYIVTCQFLIIEVGLDADMIKPCDHQPPKKQKDQKYQFVSHTKITTIKISTIKL